MKKLFVVLILLSSIFFSGCRKDQSNAVGLPNGNGNPPELVQTTIKILVLNEKEIIVAGAKVEAGNKVVYTNEFGFAEIKDVMAPANKALVKVNFRGYFEAYRTLAVENGTECFGKVKLQPYQLAGTLQSAAGGMVTIDNEVKLSFPVNAFVNKSDGSAYTGTVMVYAKYLNPEAPDFALVMPGDLSAEDNGDRVLKSFGMVNVEIKSSADQPLALKPGVKATLQATIPPALLTSASATIPLWFFDTEKNVWIKDGVAARQGGNYSGEVSHFTWWNFDEAFPRIFISGRLIDTSGAPIVNSMVVMHASVSGVKVNSYTNIDGYFRVAAPPNSICGISAYSEGCNIPFFNTPVTTGATNLNLGAITATILNQSRFNISGNFQGCSNQPVQTGSLKVYTRNSMFEGRIINGMANISFSFCSDSVDALIIAEDLSTNKIFTTSKRLYKNIAVNLGSRQVCDTSSQLFIRYIVDNQLFYIAGNTIDRVTSHYFGFGAPWVQVAHNNWSNPQNLTTKIYFNATLGNGTGAVTTLVIKDFPSLSNLSNNRELTNRFDNYVNTPGAIIKGTMGGRMYDTGINQWRIIDVAYSVVQQ